MGKTTVILHAVFMTLYVQFASPLKCAPGTFLYTIAYTGEEFCIECLDGTYMPLSDHQQTACRACEEIRKPEVEILVSPCNKTHDTVIHCVDGYYRDEARNPRETGQCKKCKHCEFPGQPCSTYKDTVCCPDENFDVVPNHHGCRERPWFCRRGQYFETKGFYCLPCPDNTFMPLDYHSQRNCWECRDLEADRPLHSVIIEPCNSTHAPVIGCEDGFFRDPKMSYRDDAIGCSPCTVCRAKTDIQYEGRKCDSIEDTVCCPQANMAVVDTPEGPVCCLEADMTIVNSSDGLVCSAESATCGAGYCLLYYISNGSSTCAPCFDNIDLDQPDSDHEDSTTLSDDNKRITVAPKKEEDKGKTITHACNNVGFTILHFLIGLVTGMIIIIIFVIILFKRKCLRESFLGTWICDKARSLTERCTGLDLYGDYDREAQKPLNTSDNTAVRRKRKPRSRNNSMSDYEELEQSFGNELDLKAKKETCPRLLDHKHLLSVDDFAIDNLPTDFRDQMYIDYIKAARDLTVRLRVYHISEDRPENDPYYELRGLTGIGLRRYGNGLVYQASKRFDKSKIESCPCKDCQVFPENAKTHWAEFLVVTSAQIVFDETECSQTSCKLWNGKDENPGKILSLKGWKVKKIDRDKDICIMGCISHDQTVIKELEERVDNFNILYARNKQAPNDTDDVNKLAVLIGHPHGLSKRIFLRNAKRGQVGMWTYDDYTCPGCFGTPVCLLSKKKGRKILITIYNGNLESRGFELDDGMSATKLDVEETLTD